MIKINTTNIIKASDLPKSYSLYLIIDRDDADIIITKQMVKDSLLIAKEKFSNCFPNAIRNMQYTLEMMVNYNVEFIYLDDKEVNININECNSYQRLFNIDSDL